MTKLTVAQPIIEAERIEPEDDRPHVGSWFWVKGDGDDLDDEYDGEAQPKYDRGRGASAQWLACVTEVGSNYAKLKGIKWNLRLSLDELPERCVAEPNPDAFIHSQVDKHRDKVRALMGEIKRICHQLGVPFHQALAEAEAPSQALAVAHGTSDVDAYGKALVKAKDETLPGLFARVKKQHEHMAVWMKAELIPAEAELARATGLTDVIKGKIHTVELYAGLQERLEQIREGEPAPVDAKVHLMQRRCYMDEECLARYEAGGMDFEDIAAFDKWIARDENMSRILPHERCIVAFRVRRLNKDYEIDSLERFIRFRFHNDYNKWTFLYIRNGRQLWRMHTSIEFGSELFPRREDEDFLNDDEIWVEPGTSPNFISGQTRAGMVEGWKRRRKETAARLWAWKRADYPDEDTQWVCDPSKSREEQERAWQSTDRHAWPAGVSMQLRQWGRPDGSDEIRSTWQRYERIAPEHIYYDDAMKHVTHVSMEHNRVAVIVQGLLDRSTCLHPHPPWRIWTPEGFTQGIELVYDVSLAMTSGPQPDWHGYHAQLNKSLRVGAFVIGHRAVFDAQMEEEREAARAGYKRYSWRDKWGKGPNRIARIEAIRGGKAKFSWSRESMRGEWVPSKPGWKKKVYKELEQSWWCPLEELTCIDAYTPGDFHMFFDDPRTRANYLQWAPILLSAEDWHAKRMTATDETDMEGDDD